MGARHGSFWFCRAVVSKRTCPLFYPKEGVNLDAPHLHFSLILQFIFKESNFIVKCYLVLAFSPNSVLLKFENIRTVYNMLMFNANQGPHPPRWVPLQVFPGHFPGQFSSISRFLSLRGSAKSAIFQVFPG